MTGASTVFQEVGARRRTSLWLAAMSTLLTAMVLSCGTERGSPLLSQQDYATATAAAQAAAAAPGATVLPTIAADRTSAAFGFEYRDTFKFAEWEDLELQVANQIVGYIFVHGYVYKAEMVPVTDGSYQAALESGEADAVLKLPRSASPEWYEKVTKSGAVIDLGSLYGQDSDLRIAFRSDFRQRAPELADMLANFTPGESVMTELGKRVVPGRTGIRPSAVAQIYFKNNRDHWSRVLPAPVVSEIDAALEAGKTGLVRVCLISGTAQGGGNLCK